MSLGQSQQMFDASFVQNRLVEKHTLVIVVASTNMLLWLFYSTGVLIQDFQKWSFSFICYDTLSVLFLCHPSLFAWPTCNSISLWHALSTV